MLCSALTQKGLKELFNAAIDQVMKKRLHESDVFKKAAETDCQLIWFLYTNEKPFSSIKSFFHFLCFAFQRINENKEKMKDSS